MPHQPIAIDPAKIAAKIEWHRAQITRLDAMLGSFDADDFQEFLVPLPQPAPAASVLPASDVTDKPPTSATRDVGEKPSADLANGHGKEDAAYLRLRAFVELQLGTFTSDDLKAAAGKKNDRFVVFPVIRLLESEGRLRTIIKAVGLRKGVYERSEPPESADENDFKRKERV